MTFKTLRQTCRAGALRAPATLFTLLALSLLLPPHSRAQEKGRPTADSILDVKIGMTIDEAHSKLKELGTGGGRDTREGGRKEV